MALDWAMSGGQFCESLTITAAGLWISQGGNVSIVSNAPAGRATTYAYHSSSAFGNSGLTTPSLGNFSTLYAGQAVYQTVTLSNNTYLIGFQNSSGTSQFDVRYNSSGQLYFTINGTQIGSSFSAPVISANSWFYIELKAIFSCSGAGTCEVRVNSVVVLTETSVTNATSGNVGSRVVFSCGDGTNSAYQRDMYVIDGVSGQYTSYLGDITVAEIYPNGAGVNSAWAINSGLTAVSTSPFTLTSVNTAGVYQGTITGGASNAYVGYNFNITGFVNGGNNPTGAICTASSVTALTFGALTTISETHAGSAAFQCVPQIGINATGTIPNGDAIYLADSTTNDISDFSHTAIVLTGNIEGVVHMSYMRKDDGGARSAAQACLSSGTTSLGTTISLGGTYQYYNTILETDPHTSSPWTVNGFNAATFGVKEIT